jgi:glycosyltransferase involved in cell wall biosynthesis
MLTGYAGVYNNFELDGIGFPVKKLRTFEDMYKFLPVPARGMVYGLTLPHGLNGKMYRLEKELQDKDIIHTAETYTGYSYQAARIRKEQNKKLVITVWENIPFLSTHLFRGFDGIPLVGEGLRSRLTGNDRVVRYVKENADVLIAVTEHAKAALMVEGVPEEKIRVLPVGVDTERFKPAPADRQVREKLGASEGDFVVLFVGRVVKEKGVYELLQAAKLISLDPDLKHVKIAIAGNGPEKIAMQRYIKALGVQGCVSFIGGIPYSQMPQLYGASDAFVLPSVPAPFWQEQFGMVLVEAMASGLPVISTCCGSIPEVLGDAGAIVEPNDPLSLYDEVRKLALDCTYHDKLSRSGRKRAVGKFNIYVVSRKIESVYMELVG